MIFNENFKNYLIKKNIIEKDRLEHAYEVANINLVPLHLEIIKQDLLSEKETFISLAEFFNLHFQEIQLTEINFDLVNKYSREKIIEFQAIPYIEKKDQVIFLISNPFRIEEVQEFKYDYQKDIVCFLATPSLVSHAINFLDNKIQQSEVLNDYSSQSSSDISEANSTDPSVNAPIITLCDSILKDAVSRGASDIHIEPFEEAILLRFRIDGKLVLIDRIANHLYPSILARFKIMAEMNIAERRIPQDGKITLKLNDLDYDFRVSTMPTLHGEKIVIRIYNINFSSNNLDVLGFNKSQERLVLNMISKPHGIILLTGPTGSGKSTSLYAFLRYLNKEDTNIITVEDPVENQIVGVNQVQVNPKANLTFATALRSILRQDPNIIMIGEIRDEETAQIATRAAITGHLVLSTIHTNDAAGVIARLINMGIPRYLVADSLVGAISQRLVRKLCPECKIKKLTTRYEKLVLGLERGQKIYQPCGCRLCNNTGYVGRTGVFEILVSDSEVKEMIMSDNFNTTNLNNILQGKMTTLMESAKELVLKGETSIEEYMKLSEYIEK